MKMKGVLYQVFVLILLMVFVGNGAIAQEKMYLRMADSEMKRFPEAWRIDSVKRPVFGYCHGVVTLAMLKAWKQANNKKYYQYVEQYADMMINDEGKIMNYDYINGRHNIDMINAGKILFAHTHQTIFYLH